MITTKVFQDQDKGWCLAVKRKTRERHSRSREVRLSFDDYKTAVFFADVVDMLADEIERRGA